MRKNQALASKTGQLTAVSGGKPISVAIIEDDPMTRAGLVQAVRELPGIELVDDSPSVEKYQRRQLGPVELILLDLRLRGGGLSGPDAVRHLCDQGSRVLVVSMFEQEEAVLDAITAGAHGYLTKEAEAEEVAKAITTVADGRPYFSATVAGYLLREPIRLTNREKQVLRLLAAGETDAQIAAELVVSLRTVNGHLERIRNKTGFRRRAELTSFAYRRGLVK
jgi:DNA-binding NarL/FixJ family response regulator